MPKRYSECKTAEDFDRLLNELLQLDNAYLQMDQDRETSLSHDYDPDSDEWLAHEQARREWFI